MIATPAVSAIPDELIERRQWVAWRPGQRGGKTTKIPINPHTGKQASSTGPATWGTFTQARERAGTIQGGGIGFVFAADDPYAGVDLDGCRDPATGAIADWARPIIRDLDSYTEVSPSGRGVHIIVRGRVPPDRNRAGPIEMYSAGRYFTMTGHPLDGTPAPIADRQDALSALHGRIFPAKPPSPAPAAAAPLDVTDDALIERAMAAANGWQFRALWAGDTSAHGGDHSAADLALCDHLMFWTGNDHARADRLFRQSGLYRGKWERADYRERTLGAAMQANVYSEQPVRAPRPIRPVGRDAGDGLDAPIVGYNLTDVGNGRRLVAMFGDRLRYCHQMGRWFAWTGSHWEMDETGRVEGYAKAVARAIYQEGLDEGLDPKERAARAKHAIKSEARERIKAMVDMAKSEDGISIHPDELDADPYLLTVTNGTLNLRTGRRRPHRPEDFITKIIPVDDDPAATCPRWLAFLDRAMAGNARLIAFLQRAVGYSLTASTDERVMFIPYGRGGNGKSTLLETIQILLGGYATRTATQTLMVKRYEGVPNDIAALRGRRFVFTTESEEGERLAEARIKDLTGGDRQTARFMRGEWFEFTPTFKIWLATNNKPEIRGTDDAIWDRIRLIPFTVRIPETERIPKHELLAAFRAELPGILAWAVAGAREWFAHGLGTPDEVRQATQDYRTEMDILAQWLADCCIVRPTVQAPAKDLYHSYVDWCEENGTKPISQQAWGRRLAERGLERGRGTGGQHRWRGIGLLADSDPLPPKGSLPISLATQGGTDMTADRVTLSDAIYDITPKGDLQLGVISETTSLRVTSVVPDADTPRDSKGKQPVTLFSERVTPGAPGAPGSSNGAPAVDDPPDWGAMRSWADDHALGWGTDPDVPGWIERAAVRAGISLDKFATVQERARMVQAWLATKGA